MQVQMTKPVAPTEYEDNKQIERIHRKHNPFQREKDRRSPATVVEKFSRIEQRELPTEG